MIVLGDIHGRTFWKDAINGRENEKIIFLGDYLDPYEWEYLKDKDVIENFKEIIQFKKDHPNNVVLLIGNHDYHYIEDNFTSGGRMMMLYFDEILKLFTDNIDLFQFAHEEKIGNKTFLFTHAGVRSLWLEEHQELNLPQGEGLAEALNTLFKQEDKTDFIKALSDVSRFRWGMSKYGSPLWADVHEHMEDETYKYLLPYYQVFGHTQQEKDPIFTKHYACLDCRKAFEIDNEGNFIMING